MTKSTSSTPKRNSNKIGLQSLSDSPQTKGGRQKFESYWNEPAIAAGLSSGQLIIGQLRINPKNYVDAYVNHSKGDADVFIPGTKARNRGLNGDFVVVRLETVKNWRVYDSFLSEKVRAWVSDSRTHSVSGNASFVTVKEFLACDPEDFVTNIQCGIEWDLNSYIDPINLPNGPSANLPWWQMIQRIGSVVAIYRRLNSRVCVGFLRPLPFPSRQAKRTKEKGEQAETKEEMVTTPPVSDWHLALLAPTDTRFPRIVIPRASCPQDFIRQPESFKLVRFVARITDWPEDSVYSKGLLIRRFDDETMSCIDAETDRILVNAGFPLGLEQVTNFPSAVEIYAANEVKTLISPANLAAEYAIRRDFRCQCVFTIDPRTARDLDDALHVRRLNPSEVAALEQKEARGAAFEVGVHISDVSFYVRPKDPVDVEAASRATSIYLTQLCVPMLPRVLCDDLCSLHPLTDKLTFSVVFVVTEDARILTKWFGRTIIHSRAKLSYEDAQAFLDDPDRDWQSCDLPHLDSDADVKEICRGVLMLSKLAEKMRTRRIEGGALQLNQVKSVFTIDDSTGLPIGVAPFVARPANHLVEEWMLAANEAVATVLAHRLPHAAFLRRHPPPTTKQMNEVCSLLRSIGVNIDSSSAGSVQDSLNRLSGNVSGTIWQHSDNLLDLCASMMGCAVVTNDATPSNAHAAGAGEGKTLEERSLHLVEEARLLTTLNILTKCMNLAEYFCLGTTRQHLPTTTITSSSSFYTGHYALNMAFYTHFTSPIRRYADLTVHRQLSLILAASAEKANSLQMAKAYRDTCTSEVLIQCDELAAIADFCNYRKLSSRRASEESAEVFFTIFVKECGPLTEACSVVSVLSRAFDVLILSTGLVRRVYLDKLNLLAYDYEAIMTEKNVASGTGVLHLRWKVCLAKGNEENPKSCEPLSPLLPDPAVISLVPSVNRPAPCGCFCQELHLFDLCRCLLTVEEAINPSILTTDEAEVDPSNVSITRGNKSNQLPKLKVTMLRPTCAICETYE